MSGLHLHAISNTDPVAAFKRDKLFLVLQRSNGSWSPGAKIMTVAYEEEVAEAMATQFKKLHPQQIFGVFMLRSEAREVANPIEIVRVGDGPEAA